MPDRRCRAPPRGSDWDTPVIHRTDDRNVSVEGGRFLAKHIPGSRYLEFPGVDHLPIVGSTEKAAAVGDHRWRDLLDTHHTAIRRTLSRFRGHKIKTTGDGALATFDGPARGVRCACAIADELKSAPGIIPANAKYRR